MRLIVCGMLLLGLSACSWSFGSWGPAAESQQALDLHEFIASKHRSPAYVGRDGDRHPEAALKFFGLQPQLAVVEVWPGGGYWTEILAPYLRDGGRYVAAHFAASHLNTPEWRKRAYASFEDKLAADPKRYDQVLLRELGPPQAWAPVPANSADLVLTFRNVHNWMKGEYAPRMFEAFHDMLKPGGVLGVVEHRAKPGTSMEEMIRSGYVTEAHVIALAEAAGLRLQARSEINANRLDSKDHPAGVWTLPPSLRLGDQDKEKYLTIGESDRMTLRFVKPILMAPGG